MDRFLLHIHIGYPTFEQEKRILAEQKLSHPLDSLRPVLSSRDVVRLQHLVREVKVAEPVADYLLTIISRTRGNARLEIGASPRAALGLYRGAQALAFIEGRDYCLPDDVKRLVEPVLLHRLAPPGSELGRDGAVKDELRRIVASVAVPT